MLRVIQASPLGKLIRLWDAVQVELQGRYSLSRFNALQRHNLSVSTLRNVLTVVFAPLPCLVVVTAIDMLPLNTPRLGFWKQTPWLVFRIAFIGWIMGFMLVTQVHNSSPSLPLSTIRLWIITLAAAFVTGVGYCLLSTFVAFPPPFATQLLTPSWLATLIVGMYLSWRRALRRDTETRKDLRCYTIVVAAQAALILVYAAFNIAFTSVDSDYQTYVAFCLPVIKLLFKNVVDRGIYHMEDLAPTTIVFNVDVFHALFVSSTMRQAKTGGSVILVMIVDVGQAITALYEVQNVLVRIRRNVSRIAVMENSSTNGSIEIHRLQSLGLIEYVLSMLGKHDHIRDHPQLNLPRHLRAPKRQSLVIAEPSHAAISGTFALSTARVHLSAPEPEPNSSLPPGASQCLGNTAAPSITPPTKLPSAD